MKKGKFAFTALLFLSVLLISRAAFGWGSTGGDGSNYGALQETAVFYNNSDTQLLAGNVVVIDRSATATTTLGAYVTRTIVPDSIEVMGIVKTESANDTPVVVVTRGPIQARALDSSDPVYAGTAVGTSTTAGYIGGGKRTGFALEAGDGTDTDELWIWVDPLRSQE